jgi:transposase
MQYITGTNRYQTAFITLDERVHAENPVRLIDAFVDKLDLLKIGFQISHIKSEGRPPFAPQMLLKLHLYGYLNKIRSPRMLQAECCPSIDVQCLLQNLQPTYHTIANFRKHNAAALQNMFKLYVQFLGSNNLLGKNIIGIDGSRFKAVNNKKNNNNKKIW